MNFEVCQYILTIISPWKRAWPLIWTNLNPLHPCKDALCQDWLKLAQLFWRRRFLIFVNVFLLFCNYIPLKKDVVLHLNKQESPSPKDALIQICMVEIGLMVLKMKMKMWKVDNNDDDNGRQTNCDQKKLTWTFGSGELIKNVKDLIRMHNFNPL